MPPTVMVTSEPDRSGNYVCDGAADDVDIQLAIAYAAALSGTQMRKVLLKGDFEIADTVSMDDLIYLETQGTITLADGADAHLLEAISKTNNNFFI